MVSFDFIQFIRFMKMTITHTHTRQQENKKKSRISWHNSWPSSPLASGEKKTTKLSWPHGWMDEKRFFLSPLPYPPTLFKMVIAMFRNIYDKLLNHIFVSLAITLQQYWWPEFWQKSVCVTPFFGQWQERKKQQQQNSNIHSLTIILHQLKKEKKIKGPQVIIKPKLKTLLSVTYTQVSI